MPAPGNEARGFFTFKGKPMSRTVTLHHYEKGTTVGVLRVAVSDNPNWIIDHWLIFDLHVDPTHRGRGIGTGLMRRICKMADLACRP